MNEAKLILLADDSENDILLTRIALTKAGLVNPLREVHNGEAAIAYLKGEVPYGDRKEFPQATVLLLDLNMPRKNGFEVIRWVRSQPGLRRLTIYVTSASIREEDIKQAFDLGANAFLMKPGTLDDLIRMMQCMGTWMHYNQFPPLNDTPLH